MRILDCGEQFPSICESVDELELVYLGRDPAYAALLLLHVLANAALGQRRSVSIHDKQLETLCIFGIVHVAM